MTGKAGLKGGLVGGGVAAILILASLIPCVGCIMYPLSFVAYAVAGGLAAYWLPKPRVTSDGAAAGAVAGAISGAIGGLVTMVTFVIEYFTSGGAEAVIQALPPETLEQLSQLGIDPYALVSGGTYTVFGAVCCGLVLLAAVALGALVGAIFATAARGNSGIPQAGALNA